MFVCDNTHMCKQALQAMMAHCNSTHSFLCSAAHTHTCTHTHTQDKRLFHPVVFSAFTTTSTTSSSSSSSANINKHGARPHHHHHTHHKKAPRLLAQLGGATQTLVLPPECIIAVPLCNAVTACVQQHLMLGQPQLHAQPLMSNEQ